MRISDWSSDVCSSDLEILDKLLAERGVRPTAMQPLWDVAGFALGAATALMGPRAAMACTAAVETEIERHYNEQLDAIGDHDPELTAPISDFRDEEVEHRRPDIAQRAAKAPAYPPLTQRQTVGEGKAWYTR